MGAIRDAIAAALADGSLTDTQKRALARQIRAEAIRDAVPTLPHTFTRGVYSITVEAGSYLAAQNAIQVTLSATKNGVPFSLNNPFIFVNPPIHIDDPINGDVQRIDPKTGHETGRFREDPLAALRQIIVDAVKAQAP